LNNIEIALRLNLGNFTAQAGAAAGVVRKMGSDMAGVGKSVGTGLQGAGASAKQFGADVGGAFKGVGAGIKQAGSEVSGFGRKLAAEADIPKVSLEGLSRGAMVMGAGMLAGFGLATKATMEFDAQLSELAAVSGATGAQMSQLREQALQMGADTAFSASEAAEAQTELSKAGVSTADIMGGALSGALGLAGAGSLALAEAATIAANTMVQFGLSGKDVESIADALANAANSTGGDVADFGASMNQTALVADQLGLSMEDTVGTLTAFAYAGLKGSDAGTSMKTMLASFIPKSVEAAATMEQLGLEFFDAQGNFVGISEAAGQLQEKMSGLTVEQRAAAMQTIFGSDAVRAANILYQEGAAGIEGWIDSVSKSGTASLMAAQKMNNLKGDIEQLKGSLETALIGVGDAGTGPLRSLVQNLTGVVNAFNGLPGPAKAGVGAVLGIGGAAITAVGALGALYPKLVAGKAALASMGTVGQAAAGNLKGFVGIVGTIGAVAGALSLLDGAAKKLRPIEEFDGSALENSLLNIAEGGKASGDALGLLGEDFGGLEDAMSRVFDKSNAEGVLDIIHPGDVHDLEQAKKSIDDVDKALASLAAKDPGAAATAFERISDAMIDAGMSTGDVESAFDDYGSALLELDTSSRTAEGATDSLTGAVGEQAGAYEEAESALRDYLDAQKAQFDPLFAAIDATNGVRDAQVGYEDALVGVEDAQGALNAAIAEHGRNSPEAAAASRDLAQAQRDLDDSSVGAAQAALEMDQALVGLADGVSAGSVSVGDATAMLNNWVAAGWVTQGQADQVAAKFGILSLAADDVAGKRVDIPISETGGPATRAELHGVRDAAMLTDEQNPIVAIMESGAGNVVQRIFSVVGAARVADAQAPNIPVSESGSGNVVQRLFGVTGAARTTGAQRPNVGVSETGAGNVIQRLFGVGGAARAIPSSRHTSLGATDNASGTIGSVQRSLNGLRDRSITVSVHYQKTGDAAAAIQAGKERRWGGAHEMRGGVPVDIVAATGAAWQAGVYRDPTILFGERQTGGEAMIPRLGNRDRSERILETAAGWYDLAVVPADSIAAATGYVPAGAGGGVGAAVDLAAEIRAQTGVTEQGLRHTADNVVSQVRHSGDVAVSATRDVAGATRTGTTAVENQLKFVNAGILALRTEEAARAAVPPGGATSSGGGGGGGGGGLTRRQRADLGGHRSPGDKSQSILLGSISRARWDQLMAQGWHGHRDDHREALWPPHLAAGGWVKAKPGGIPAVVGEGRWDELVAPEPMVRSLLEDAARAGGARAVPVGRTVVINAPVNVALHAGNVIAERDLLRQVEEIAEGRVSRALHALADEVGVRG
jgi:TP901 family phage tail tape measure protein